MNTARKILKLPKRERDKYIDVVEKLYINYCDNFGTKIMSVKEGASIFTYYGIDFLDAITTNEIIDFLESEKILMREVVREGKEYETATEVTTITIHIDHFNALVSGLNLDTVPKHIQELPEITFDASKRSITCGDKSIQLRDRNSFVKVVLAGIFDSYPQPFALTDDIIVNYGLNESKQTLAGISNSINNRLKTLLQITENPLTYANYIFTLRQGLKLKKIGNDPRDYS